MKIYIMTDIEGVCGVINFNDWAFSAGKYYESAKRLLTLEVNAAVEGFFEAGAEEIYVSDGHGPGGINHELLDSRTRYIRGYPTGFPFFLDKSFDAIAWIGQHAKAGTEYSHLTHTQDLRHLDCTINGISVGEFGQLALCASYLGVTPIFASGEKAFALEAKKLIQGIETVWVKEGTTPGSGNDCSEEEYIRRNLSAIQLHPEVARTLIREGAKRALNRFFEDKGSFVLPEIKPPYRCEIKYRRSEDKPEAAVSFEHPDSVIGALNKIYRG